MPMINAGGPPEPIPYKSGEVNEAAIVGDDLRLLAEALWS